MDEKTENVDLFITKFQSRVKFFENLSKVSVKYFDPENLRFVKPQLTMFKIQQKNLL